ncbi:MAG: hydrolase, partial [Betaproteobacteria bacterium]|nr:hydrolase [Betaproteobacteria bacterium]
HVKPLPGIKVTAVAAEHSSLLVWNNPATGKLESHPAGEAVGYIIEMENGFKIWHMGDTGLFGDMKFINDRYKPDLVLMPIGGNFTMDPDPRARASPAASRPCPGHSGRFCKGPVFWAHPTTRGQ